MDNETFHSKLRLLAQKSRKALNLYSSIVGRHDKRAAVYSELQIAEWKAVNAELIKRVNALLEQSTSKSLVSDAFLLRDRFCLAFRDTQTECRLKQQELMQAAEKSDYVRAAVLAKELVVLKARGEASNAAFSELRAVLSGLKPDRSTDRPTVTKDSGKPSESIGHKAPEKTPPLQPPNVIPLRKRS